MCLQYAIGQDQARDLRTGSPPPGIDMLALSDWLMRRRRAEDLARYIAGDVAHKLIEVFYDPRLSERLVPPEGKVP